MVTSVRKLASTRLKPVLRRLDVRAGWARRREAERAALTAEITQEVHRRLEQEHSENARQTLPGLARGFSLTKSQKLALGELEAFLFAQPKARVAIIGGSETATLTSLIRGRFPGSTVVEIPASASESQRHVRLAASGRHHLIVATGDRDDPAELLTNVLYHLRRAGLLVVTDLDPVQPASSALLPVLSRLRTLRAHRGLPEGESVDKDERTLARAIRRVVVSDGYVVVENRTVLLAKVREEEVPLLLELRKPTFGRVLEHRDAETFMPDCTIYDHVGAESAVLREQRPYQVPALELREYADVTCCIGQVLVKDQLLLPDSYRHNQRTRLHSRKIEDLAPRFGRLRYEPAKLIEVSGTHFYWDGEYPGHFGHVLTEQVSRLWALSAARERYPDLKVMFGRRYGHKLPQSFELTVLAAAGFEPEQIQLNLRSAQVERVLAATPMLSMPEYVSPQIAAVWDLVGDRIAAAATCDDTPRRIFCSRRMDKRSCRNAPQVEELFTSHGFEVIYPEDLSMADQIVTFRNAEQVAGFAGSALFNLMFCPQPKPVVIVASETYTATNEYLIGAVRGHSFDVFWSRADEESFQSDFAVDLDREGRQLARHLSSLS